MTGGGLLVGLAKCALKIHFTGIISRDRGGRVGDCIKKGEEYYPNEQVIYRLVYRYEITILGSQLRFL